MADLQARIKRDFAAKRILILGDLVADQFLDGTISRVSREAPVFILKHEQTVTLPGAAANAAANVAALGGSPVLIGLAGGDANGTLLIGKLREMGVATDAIVIDDSAATTTKVRVLAGRHYATRQQVIRIDYENSMPAPPALEEKLLNNIRSEAHGSHAIVVSDYGCGSVTERVFETARDVAREENIPLIVDSRHRLSEFAGATTATPNREEVEAILGTDLTDDDCSELRERLGLKALLITNGNEGMLLVESGKQPLKLEAVGSKEPVDVTGAGDTVIAAYSLGLASGLSFADAARVANHAGGIVVMKKGTAVVSVTELCASLATEGTTQASTAS